MSDDSHLDTPPTRGPEPGDELRRPSAIEPQVGDRLGHYLLREVLGQGGMGRVFGALDERLKREVALKVMLPHFAAEETQRRRFLREARAMAALDHPHVVSVFNVNEVGPVPYFVMPLLRGETLQARMGRERALPVAEVIRIGRQTANGLAHAHEKGLIHRDVKPLNLWLEEGTGNVKILDFGLARMDRGVSTSITRPGEIFGTPDFMAPEQWAGGEVDHRCDQYALGCVLYRICTGLPPTGKFPDPDNVNPGTPRELSELILRLLCYNAGGRFANMREVAEAFDRAEVQPESPTGAGDGLKTPQVPGYEILGELGRGGMGVVYKARHKDLNRAVALKFVLTGTDMPDRYRAYFRSEAELIAKLQHPNIIQIYDVGEAGGRIYLALEFAEGGSLRDHLTGPLEPHAAARLVETLARALEYAHRQGVVHRDVKPANVLLTAGGDSQQDEPAGPSAFTPKLTDFWLASLAELKRPECEPNLGTPRYSVPDRLTGRSADVWGLGAMLYDLLTGRPPFSPDTGDGSPRGNPAPPSKVWPGVPRDLDIVCMKCLREDPAGNYTSAGELAQDLQRFLAGEPLWRRVGSRLIWGAVALTVLAVAAAVGWLLTYAFG